MLERMLEQPYKSIGTNPAKVLELDCLKWISYRWDAYIMFSHIMTWNSCNISDTKMRPVWNRL